MVSFNFKISGLTLFINYRTNSISLGLHVLLIQVNSKAVLDLHLALVGATFIKFTL
jgi:hypothetical protein